MEGSTVLDRWGYSTRNLSRRSTEMQFLGLQNSNDKSVAEAQAAIDRYFRQRNDYFKQHPCFARFRRWMPWSGVTNTNMKNVGLASPRIERREPQMNGCFRLLTASAAALFVSSAVVAAADAVS